MVSTVRSMRFREWLESRWFVQKNRIKKGKLHATAKRTETKKTESEIERNKNLGKE